MGFFYNIIKVSKDAYVVFSNNIRYLLLYIIDELLLKPL